MLMKVAISQLVILMFIFVQIKIGPISYPNYQKVQKALNKFVVTS